MVTQFSRRDPCSSWLGAFGRYAHLRYLATLTASHSSDRVSGVSHSNTWLSRPKILSCQSSSVNTGRLLLNAARKLMHCIRSTHHVEFDEILPGGAYASPLGFPNLLASELVE